eukprot:scaffold35423_cov35-Prasinocladus_malaysianus.AAC.5
MLLCSDQVKVAEHILTGHKVAIKILNRRKIKAMDMEEKAMHIAQPNRLTPLRTYYSPAGDQDPAAVYASSHHPTL